MTPLKRAIDIVLSLLLIAVLLIPCLFIGLLIRWSSPGPAIHWSKRVGRYNRTFFMPKFRTMAVDVPQVATHLLSESSSYVTRVGAILRKLSLDEIPQLWSILRGDMTFVGPRPALFNQHDLVALRTEKGIDQLVPGLTGWAQVNGRDDLPIPVKVEFDHDYLQRHSMWMDLKILVRTFTKAAKGENVSH
jgi:O-antigen biosynthesis protein WbqP